MLRLVVYLAVVLAAVVSTSGNAVPDRRIIGGVSDDSAHYMASLETTAFFHFCGAVILTGHYVLTAAHCIAERTPQFTYIIAGMTQLGNRGEAHLATTFIPHPYFNANSMANDIALIFSIDLLNFQPELMPLPIGHSHVLGGSIGMFHGWGYTNYPNVETPIYLKGIPLDVLTNSDCRARSASNIATMIQPSNLCTLTRAGQGACSGDAGSPLVINNEIVGIASWGILCAQGLPDVFVRVASYAQWIHENSDYDLIYTR